MQKIPIDIAIGKIQKYCAYQERCSFDVINKLKTYSLQKDQVSKVLDQLRKTDYLNDPRFAENFTRGKFRIKKWGRKKIYFELKKKQMEEGIIKKALQHINDEEYLLVIKELIEQKWIDIKEKDLFKKKSKIGKQLISRGFEENLVWELIKEKK